MHIRSMTRASLAALVLCAAASAAPIAATSAPRGGEFAYEKVAQDFINRHGLKDTPRDKLELEPILAAHFVHGRFGQFEVYFPARGLEDRAEDLKSACAALLEAQLRWLDWVKPLGLDQKPIRKDLEAFAAWVGKWNVGALQKIRDAGGRDLLELMLASESMTASAQRVADGMGRCTPLGTAREEVLVAKILMIPDRRSFVEFVCFLGWMTPELQSMFWVPNVADWSQSFYNEYQIVALEYAATGRAAGDYTQGTSMNERDPGVMQQQVVQLSMNSLFDQQYGQHVPKEFVGGLSMNLVIDQFANISTKVDGDLRERTTAAVEIFVPGGASSGGTLAPNSADSRWREDRGRDHFVRMLRLAQNEGEDLEKKAKNRLACFAIRADNGGSKVPVVGPFLGSVAAETKVPPDDFRGDFLDFLRAYKCGFIYWLQTKAGGNEKASREKFAVLIQKLGDPHRTGDFEGVFKEVYDDAPLSSLGVDKNTLEGKFLTWLSKQKDSK